MNIADGLVTLRCIFHVSLIYVEDDSHLPAVYHNSVMGINCEKTSHIFKKLIVIKFKHKKWYSLLGYFFNFQYF